MKTFVNRFGERKPLKKPTDLKFDFSIGDVVLSASKGLCLIQGYGIYDNTYWVETGTFSASDWVFDVAKKASKSERSVFLTKYYSSFKNDMLNRFWPKGDPFHNQTAKHLTWITRLQHA